MNIRFRQALFGRQVLQVRDRRPLSTPGHWKDFWRDATLLESQDFEYEIAVAKHDLKTFHKIKADYPELVI